MASELIVQTLKGPTSGANANKIIVPSGQTLAAAGHVVQVKQSVYTSTWSGGGDPTTFYTTPLSVTITPASTSSKILVQVFAHIGSGYWEIQGRLIRNSTPIGLGDARGLRTRATFSDTLYEGSSGARNSWSSVTASFLDEPASTASLTYGLQLNGYSTYSVSLNYNIYADTNSADYNATPISTITVMEIAG